MVTSNKNQHTSTTENSYNFSIFNLFDYKISTALFLITGYRAYKMYYNYGKAKEIQDNINLMSSEEMAQGYELFNDIMKLTIYVRKASGENQLNKFNILWEGLQKTEDKFNNLVLAINNMDHPTHYTNNVKDILFNNIKGYIGQLDRAPNIPSKEAVQSYLSDASFKKMYAFIGSAALTIHGYFNGFSDSNLYNKISGEQPEQAGAL